MNELENMECWKNLANAIVANVAEEYLDECAGFKNHSERCREKNMRKLERFFASDWCAQLTGCDPRYIVTHIRKAASEMVLKYTAAQDENGYWYVCRVGKEDEPLTPPSKAKRTALWKAAELQGLNRETYFKIRRRDGIK